MDEPRRIGLGVGLVRSQEIFARGFQQSRRSCKMKQPQRQESSLEEDEIVRQYASGRRDFSNLQFLRYLDLREVDLPEIVFRNCHMEGNFNDSNLQRADFSFSYIKTVDFHRTNLIGASFCGAMIDAAEFCGAQLQDADFQGATAYQYIFSSGERPSH